jgi:hypothetical protein
MIPNHPVAELVAWLLFALVLCWALWQSFPEFVQWLGHSSDGGKDLDFFPDELRGEPGRGMLAGSGGAIDMRDERSRRDTDPRPQPGDRPSPGKNKIVIK